LWELPVTSCGICAGCLVVIDGDRRRYAGCGLDVTAFELRTKYPPLVSGLVIGGPPGIKNSVPEWLALHPQAAEL
jgi:hypothetical protein